MHEQLRNLERGDRFITRSGKFGTEVQDYFAVDVSTVGDGMMIRAVSANVSNHILALDYELQIPSWSTGFTDVWADATGRWYVTWPGKRDGPDLLETVEPARQCVLCGGVRSIGWIDGEVACIDCRGKLLDGRICGKHPHGEMIPVFCDQCGSAHSTKNIGAIGARGIHAIYEDSCCCRKGSYFHDCGERLFVKGDVRLGKFRRWVDKYAEDRG